MNASSALSTLYFKAQSLAFSDSPVQSKQQQTSRNPTLVSENKESATVTILPARETSFITTAQDSASPSALLQALASPTAFKNDGFTTPKATMDKEQDKDFVQLKEMPSPSPMSSTGKRKRLDMDDLSSFMSPTPTRRKGSSDFLRKGQWTPTEERLARLLIDAFEEGYLPIYTGIRLRGYLAVQLQCDPMRVSKKLCAGTIDGKPVPKNFGQKKYKLRKKTFWDNEEAENRVIELEKVTKAMWTEARLKKPSFLTLSTTRNVAKRREADEEEEDSASSPSSPGRGRSPSSTPRIKKQKVFPIIYLNLSKKLKRYSYSSSEPSSPSMDSDSDSDLEPVRLDGESLQAAYDLLTLCSPRGSSSKAKKTKKKRSVRSKKATAIKTETMSIKEEDAPTQADKTDADVPIKSEEVLISLATPTFTTSSGSEISIKIEPSA